jgi:t-SNARE complex subunit (syntaxin)
MTEQYTEAETVLSPKEARAAKPVKGMRWVLGVSLAAIIIIMVVVMATQVA